MNYFIQIKTFFSKIKFPAKKSSIKAKFISTFLLIAILISLVYTFTFAAFQDSISQYEQLIKNADIANRIPGMYNVLLDDFKNYLVSSNKGYENFKNSIDEIGNSIIYIRTNTNPTHAASISQLTGISNQLIMIKRKTSNAIEYRKKGNLDAANQEFYELAKLYDFLKDNISQYVSKELNYSIESRQEIYQKSIMLGLASTFLIIFITVMGLLYGIKLSQSTAKALLKIANLNLSDEETVETFGEEELDQLYSQFARLQRNIKEYISQLASSQKRLSTILDEMTDCVIITNENGEIEYANPAVKKTFLISQDKIIQENIGILMPNLEISNSEYIVKDKNLNPFIPIFIDGKFQYEAMRQTGEIFPVELGINKATLEHKDFFILMLHDITEHKEVEKLKDEFVSIVSHELRTPLTSIKGALEFSLSGALGELPEKILSLLQIAFNNSIRLNNLINDILDINKISEGKIDFKIENLALNPVIEETINNNLSYAKQYDVRLEFKNPPAKEICLNIDKSRFIQVLTNLVSNAVKFSHKEGKVEISVDEKEHSVIINVQDFGIGIPKKHQEKLFQRFVQVDSSSTRSKGGTGLGLNISKMLMEKMNGKITFVSEENSGTIFSIEISKSVQPSVSEKI